MTRILMYHTVGVEELPEAGAGRYSVTLTNFKEQMAIVAKSKNILLTFDDGDSTNYAQALPVLKSQRLKAIFFIIPGRVGTKGYMGWDEVRALDKAGMAIGAHGMTHRILTTLGDDELRQELKGSKDALEKALGKTVRDLSIPRGIYDARVVRMAREAGFARVFTSDGEKGDRYCLGRIAVMHDWNLAHFSRVVEKGLSPADKFKEGLKGALKGILGVKNYDTLRTRLLKK